MSHKIHRFLLVVDCASDPDYSEGYGIDEYYAYPKDRRSLPDLEETAYAFEVCHGELGRLFDIPREYYKDDPKLLLCACRRKPQGKLAKLAWHMLMDKSGFEVYIPGHPDTPAEWKPQNLSDERGNVLDQLEPGYPVELTSAAGNTGVELFNGHWFWCWLEEA